MTANTRLFIIYLAVLQLIVPTQLEAVGHSFLDDHDMVNAVQTALKEVYHCRPENAMEVLEKLRQKYPEHPVTPFFEGLIYYWQYYPIIPGKKESKKFETALQESWKLAEQRLKEDPYDIDGVFFNMTARSFIVMYYSDNGKPYKAISHVLTIYREILKGMDLKESFHEFYFMVGLYNYYVEAWPEVYPVYKPVAMLLQSGNKELGLKMLHWASRNTIFLQGEASTFLILIYLNFEQNVDSARTIAGHLYSLFPENPYYTAKYSEILLLSKEYEKALILLDKMDEMDDFSRMKATVYRGVYKEKALRNYSDAVKLYRQGLQMSEEFGPYANYTTAHAYIGLSRYYDREGDEKKARHYYKKARDATGFDYVFNDDL